MCEATTILLVASAAVAAYTKYQEGQQEAAQQEQQARLQEIQAGDARLRGAAAEGISRVNTSVEGAAQTLAYANAGVDPGKGTPVQTAEQTSMFGELEARNAQNDAIREAWGFETSASISKDKARTAKARAKNEVISTLIGGGASGAGAWKGSTTVKPSAELANTTLGN